jgi:SulP family sulfate permease
LFAALRTALASPYRAADLRADLAAAGTVAVVALPLSAGLAIATGLPPQHGLWTAIVAGLIGALGGGARFNVTGPTAAFVVILAPIADRLGPGGLLLATALAGLILLGFGLGKLGQVITLVPMPVVTGFTAGVAVVIATLQLRDFLGLTVGVMPEGFPEKVAVLIGALPSLRLADLGVGASTLALLLIWPRLSKAIPAPLAALAITSVGAALLHTAIPAFAPITIADRYGAVPSGLPAPSWPWSWPGPGGAEFAPTLDTIRELLPVAFTIAVLGALESLLCAVIADGMTGDRHDPDAELVGQGLANLIVPFFGGFAATGALARTATNIRAGARSPAAAALHALFLLIAMLVLAPMLSRMPMAGLAAMLMLVAWNMSDARHVVRVMRESPRSDALVLAVCFGLTVVFDMVVAVVFGVLLASMLFMRRMAQLSEVKLVSGSADRSGEFLPAGFLHYEVNGPLFFGASRRAMGALEQVDRGKAKVLLLDMRQVPAIDATGLTNLRSALRTVEGGGVSVVLVGVRSQAADALRRAGVFDSHLHADTIEEAVAAAVAARSPGA